MTQLALQQIYQQQVQEDEAGLRAFETLLNCYCREVAGPENTVSIGAVFGKQAWPLALRAAMHKGEVMQVVMPRIECRLLVVIQANSSTGNYRYSSSAYYKNPGQSWTRLTWRKLATLLLKDLAVKYEQPFNDELLVQIHDSVAVTRGFLNTGVKIPDNEPLADFLFSEQSLRFGHPFHPAPKSRQGFSAAEVEAYSPELGASFPLHYFSVRKEFLLQRSVLPHACQELVAAHAPIQADEDDALLALHPWQADFLLKQPLLRQALADGRMKDHGLQGECYYPTSSVRTLYHPDNAYFYKGSLHVRLTNCVRKNAIYELDGALAVTRIMRELMPHLSMRFQNLRVMEEPAYQSVDLRDADEQQNRLLTEGFGMILRQGIATFLEEGITPIMAGALFGNKGIGDQWVKQLIQQHAQHGNETLPKAMENWFRAYVRQLLPPVFYCFFEHGVIFEPHLQNVVIGMRNGLPTQLFLRDFEGVKLVDERYTTTHLAREQARVRQALCYSEEKGWKRIAYCLFVNNFCEAITQLAQGDTYMERNLWAMLAEEIQCYRQQHGSERSTAYIDALLAGEAFPAKANLINRFFKRADKAVTYVPLFNPLATCREGAL